MHITSHGAAKTVTGSCHLIEAAGKKILLDCGLYQGKGSEMSVVNRHFSFDPKTIDAVILSHAHIDHSGNLPRLVKKGFKGKIYLTPATAELAEIMLIDSARIQLADAEYLNMKLSRPQKQSIQPLYTETDVTECLSYFEIVDFHQMIEIDENIQFHLTHNGHIIGSAAIHLLVKEKDMQSFATITYSGDVGRYENRILKYPESIPQSDFIILESTYGDKKHRSSKKIEEKMLQLVLETCFAKKGKLIIPAFSIGRTQEIIYILNNLAESGRLSQIDVFVDSPMSLNATEVMRNYSDEFNDSMKNRMLKDPDPFGFKQLHYIKDVKESIELNHRKDPCIIITSSGMMEGGRIRHHLKHHIGDERNSVLITGYCEPSTLGGRLLEGDKQVSIFGERYDVNANVFVLKELSAHADNEELVKYIKHQDRDSVKEIFLVHGLQESLNQLKLNLLQNNFKTVTISEKHVNYELNLNS